MSYKKYKVYCNQYKTKVAHKPYKNKGIQTTAKESPPRVANSSKSQILQSQYSGSQDLLAHIEQSLGGRRGGTE